MRLISFLEGGEARLGVALGEMAVAADALGSGGLSTMTELLADAATGLAALREGLAEWEVRRGARGGSVANDARKLEELELLAPVPRPGKVVAIGLNYHAHAAEQRVEPPSAPLIFGKFPTSVIGPGAAIAWDPALTSQVDAEAELAVVIGRLARRVSVADALDHVLGYTCGNDVSARDLQFGDRQWVRGKSLDTFCPLGPWIVTPDEIPDPHDLAMELRVNGEPRQVSHSGRMSVTIPEILSHYSALGYSAGDVLSTGTVSGVAGFSEDAASLYLKPGDVMEGEIERIGVLRNPVVSWQEAHGEPAPPRVRW